MRRKLHAIPERESPPTTALVLIAPCLHIIQSDAQLALYMHGGFIGARRTIEISGSGLLADAFASDDQIPMKKLS